MFTAVISIIPFCVTKVCQPIGIDFDRDSENGAVFI